MSSQSGGGGVGLTAGSDGNQQQLQQQQQQQQQQRGRNEPANQRYPNLIYDSEVFLTKLREFKPQSLGCLEARRKSSSTLIFPNPQQACMGPPKCPRYPHNVKPTPGYWIECHGPGVLSGKSGVSGAGASSTSALQDPHSGVPLVRCSASDELGSMSVVGPSPVGASSSNQMEGQQQQHLGRQTSSKLDDHKLIVDCPSRSSGGSSLSQHHPMPTTPTAERILTRHVKDILSNQDELDELARIDVGRRRQSMESSRDAVASSMEPQRQPLGAPRDSSAQEEASAGRERSGNFARMDSLGGSAARPASQQTAAAETAAAKDVSELRKRLNKRTMTRDDIDLHKPRRGTPNITITEPSFNQSTTSYQPLARTSQRGFGATARQGSSASEFKRIESVDAPSSSAPIKFQIQSFMSIEAQSSIDEPHESLGDDIVVSPFLRRQESSDNDSNYEDYAPTTTSAAQSSGGLDYKLPYNRQHRPSVIREDSDQEAECPMGSAAQEQREFFCGLSTQTFQKHSYQQQQQQYQYQQQQQQQQQQQVSDLATAAEADVGTGVGSSTGAQLLNADQFHDGSLDLISFEEENYEKHYYGREHWNYFTNDELLGPVMLSLKQEVNNQRDHFHVLLRTVSYTLHGTIPASTICADRYDREAIVRELSEIAKLKPPLMLGQLPSTPDELLKLDHIFIKTELKVGVIYIKAGQAESEEAILGNKEESPLFTEFLDLLGDRITLKGFDRYKGGLDTVHNLTGTESVYTMWRNIEIMFHVSTMLPHEENDPQKLQKKRHIGNDIVCVAFIESDDTLFWPGCIKSYFLHTFITIQTSPKPVKEGEKRKYFVSCVCRNEVQYAFKPYLVEQDEFYKSDYFREWLLVKIVNGERASYSAPKFARMQDRTRSQLLEDIIANLTNHLVTGQIPKPYRRGSWRPLGHTRASSPLEDSMKDYFEDYDQLAKDFCNAFCGPSRSMLCDVVFRVKDKDGSYKLVHGVRAIMAIRSRTFLEMLYGFVPPGTGPSSLQNQTNLRAIEMKALSGESSSASTGTGLGAGRDQTEQTKLLAKRGSVGADSGKKMGEKERRQSMLPNLSKSISQRPNYLTVPNTSGAGGGGGGGGAGGGGSGTGGMIKNVFNRFVSGNWSGWSGNFKGYKGEPMHIKVDQNKTKVDLNSLAICKEIAKIDADKLSQREFEIKEFDYETFQQTIEYIHNGQCKLSYETIPGLICAAEHYDLPDLLHACFHHANTHMKLSAAPKMMNALYQNSCFYVTAMQLLDSIYEFIDPLGNEFFSRSEYFELYESVFTTLLSRKTLQVSELRKFQAMHGWTKQQVAAKQQLKQQQQLTLLQKQMSLDQPQQQQDKPTQELPVVEQQRQDQQNQQLQQQQSQLIQINNEEAEAEYRNLMNRLNKEVNIKLDKISNEDLVKIVLPTKVFSNDKIFDIMADESRNEY